MDSTHIRVAQVGPAPDREGGMAMVMRDLLDSPLAASYGFETVATYRGGVGRERLAVFLRSLVALVRWCRGPGRRVVHVHSAVRGSVYRKALCVVVVKLARRPVILHFHAGPGDIDAFAARQPRWRMTLLRRAVGAADRVLAVSRASAAHLEAAFGVRGIEVVPNPAPPVVDGDAVETPGSHRPPRALYVGGFANPAKGGDVLLAALPRLDGAELEFELAGPGEPPPQLAALLAERPSVRWSGWLGAEAKREALSTCDLFVLPSVSEGLPVAVLEAMAHGRAIVATAVGGVPDVLDADADALIVPPGDPEALAAALTSLAGDPERCERLGAAARRRAAALTRESVHGRLDALYRELA